MKYRSRYILIIFYFTIPFNVHLIVLPAGGEDYDIPPFLNFEMHHTRTCKQARVWFGRGVFRSCVISFSIPYTYLPMVPFVGMVLSTFL